MRVTLSLGCYMKYDKRIRPYNGKFFITQPFTDEPRIPPFLHKDGKWRECTAYNGEFTGFYDTQDEAQKVLDDYERQSRT